MSDLSTNEDFRSWIGRKTARLSRELLDCGHPNAGEVYFHGWCDRLSCSGECAEAEHDCSAFAGAKSGTEKVSEPLEAEAPPMSDWARLAEVVSTSNAAYRCRGCRAWMPLDATLCGPCSVLPSCGAERSNEHTGRRMVCFRPDGHDAVHEDVTGSQWVGEERQVEALRLADVRVIDRLDLVSVGPVLYPPPGCEFTVTAQLDPVAPPVDELVEPVAATCPLCGHATEPGVGPCDGCNEIARTYRGPWWSRLLPDRRTR